MSPTVSTELLMKMLGSDPEQMAIHERVANRDWQGAIEMLTKLAMAAEKGGSANSRAVAEPDGLDMHQDVQRLVEQVDRIERKIDSLKGGSDAKPAGAITQSEASKVFVLMKRLEGGPKERKAPLPVVFKFLILEGLSQRETAIRCGCVESLISVRTAAIESSFGMKIERLRNFASELVSLEAAAKGERRRKKSAGRADDFDRVDGVETDENEDQESEEEPFREEDEEQDR